MLLEVEFLSVLCLLLWVPLYIYYIFFLNIFHSEIEMLNSGLWQSHCSRALCTDVLEFNYSLHLIYGSNPCIYTAV